MASRIFAFLIWASVAASATFWGLRWLGPATPAPRTVTPLTPAKPGQGDIARLLQGPSLAASPTPSASAELVNRIKLLGVVAPGLALLSVDGKPARPVRLGMAVDGALVLLGVQQKGADLGPSGGPVSLSLSLPGLAPAATGSLPKGSSQAGPTGPGGAAGPMGQGVPPSPPPPLPPGQVLLPQVQVLPSSATPEGADARTVPGLRGRPAGRPL